MSFKYEIVKKIKISSDYQIPKCRIFQINFYGLTKKTLRFENNFSKCRSSEIKQSFREQYFDVQNVAFL